MQDLLQVSKVYKGLYKNVYIFIYGPLLRYEMYLKHRFWWQNTNISLCSVPKSQWRMKFLPGSVERSVRSLNPSRATGQIEFRPESRKRAQPVLAIPFETILYASAMGVNRRNGKLLTSFLCTKNSKRQAIKGRRELMLLTLLEPSTRSPSVVCFTKLRDMDSREASSMVENLPC